MRTVFRWWMAAALAATLAVASASRAADAPSPATEKDPAKLIAILKSDAKTEVALFAKAKACQRLAAIGGPDAVPVLASLLGDAQLAHYARFGLQANPDPSVDEALRTAMEKLQGRLLVGVINSIAMRRDAQAVEALAKRLGDADAEVSSAAAAALGRIGTPEAAEALATRLTAAPAAIRPQAVDACFVCAERLAEAGKLRPAARLYDAVRKADVPKYQRLAATRWAILIRKGGGLGLLIEQITARDQDQFKLGLRVAREVPGAEVTKALAGQYDNLPPARQALLVALLADRRDAAALPAILKAAKSSDAGTRLAAVRMLAKLGNRSAIPVLLAAAVDRDAATASAAQDGLAGLRGNEGQQVDATILEKLKSDDVTTRRIAVELSGRRRVFAAAPTLASLMRDTNEPVRLAAVRAFGMTMDPKELAPLMDRMLAANSKPELAAAEAGLRAACMRATDRDAAAKQLVAGLAKASPAQKEALLQVLSATGGPAALEAVAATARAGDVDLATRLLGRWMSADAAPVLRELVTTVKDQRFKTRALSGYIRLARQLDMPVERRIAICKDAIALAWRPDEKKLAVQVLARHATPESLELVLGQLGDAAVKPAAVAAALRIAEKAATTHPAAVEKALQKLLASGLTPDQADRAKALQAKLPKAAK